MTDLLMKAGEHLHASGSSTRPTSWNFMEFHANSELAAETVIQDDAELRLTERFTPIGVVGAICPWNFPLVLAVRKHGAALVTGNCVVAKPSPYTPYSVLKLAETAMGILPPGVFQAINRDETLGPLLVKRSGIGKISFTGSTATGKRIMGSASRTLKNITLQLGGNNATIVYPDIDVASVAPQIALGVFFNSRQPVIIDNPPDASRIVMEESFGRIVPILSWSTEEEVVTRVIDTISGLGGSVWSGNLERALSIAHRVKAGTNRINSFEKPLPQGYFSGHKESVVGGDCTYIAKCKSFIGMQLNNITKKLGNMPILIIA
ncbi:related to aldehyde dehydrogenase (NAD+), mitochondrial [Phialocephala subalpina]|uniref:aldehyde dehydrogenase (NAD(+)) n=1 Tax=Phialocephala subalpina TaxID=576137 RepID=A0A1L7X192_9HELO|nr:related to aldehyde dehydrogenase (NAD+), mitochondrial [Phialocephala subalpina]